MTSLEYILSKIPGQAYQNAGEIVSPRVYIHIHNTHRTTQKHTTHSKGGDDSDSDVTKYRIKTSKENCEFFQFLSRPGIAKVWN